MKRIPGLSRRDALKLGVGLAGYGLLGTRAMGATALTELPQVTLRMGTIPFASATWFVLASYNDFLKDVGITLTGGSLPGTPRIINEAQAVPQLTNRELDIAGSYGGAVTQTLDKVPDQRAFFCYSFFVGRAILFNPDAGYKTVAELIAAGQSWSEAAKTAVGQMRGKKFSILNQPSARPFAEFALAQGGLTVQDVELIPIDDPKAVQLAVAGQVDFAAPSGAVQLSQLVGQAGFKSLIDMDTMLKSMPPEAGDLSQFLSYDLVLCTDEFMAQNQETLYRFCGAMYRTLAYMTGPKKQEAMKKFTPYLNSVSGASLDEEAVQFIFEKMTILRDWNGQKEFWAEETSPVYYKNIFEPQLKKLIADGAIQDQEYDLDTIFSGKKIWEDMSQMRREAEALLSKGSADLSGDQKELFDAAQAHFDQFNFFDALRFAKQAFG